MMERQEDLELDLYRLVAALLRRSWWLLLAGILGAGLALGGTWLLGEPEYQASVMFYVNNTAPEGEGVSSGDLTTSRNLVDSFIVLLTTRDALTEVMEYSGAEHSQEELTQMLSASAVNSTEFFRITVTGKDPGEVWAIARAIGVLLPRRIAGVIRGTTATLVEDAALPEKPVGPAYETNALTGLCIGFLLAMGQVILGEYLADRKRRYEAEAAARRRKAICAGSGKFLRSYERPAK